jgi:hypothetical protein
MFIATGVAIIAGLGFAWLHAGADVPNVKPDVKEAALMRAKLASTQRIVDGLVSKKFDDITKGAEELVAICKATEWKAHEDEAYRHHRRELTLQAEKMIAAAARENLDGAAYSYINALTTCISCHDHCRDVLKIAETESRIVPIPTTDEAILPHTSRR